MRIRTSQKLDIDDYPVEASIAMEIAQHDRLIFAEQWIGPVPDHEGWKLTFQAVMVPPDPEDPPSDPPPAPTGNGMIETPDGLIVQFFRRGEDVEILSISENVILDI